MSQDIDIYRKGKDDNVKIPNIPLGMSKQEFHLLSTNLRLKDMLYAMVVPGYVHFKAQEKPMGYAILGARAVGFIGLSAVYYSAQINDENWYDINGDPNPDDVITIGNGWEIKKSDVILVTSATLIISTYLFDWIRGENLLHRKQDKIRYKYGIKHELQKAYSYNPSSGILPIASLSIKISSL
ncbi:MAG: hypothetical protein B6I18_06330 [Bacteroidetes bacterium 4572_112]|nr:MAG: hypothetical protein B6I18_06330 [Bacteroidetes bacterium 4572_112]